MKVKLLFNLPEDQYEYDAAMNGSARGGALHQVGQDLFRPARKHGYPDREISELIEKLDKLARIDAGVAEGDYTSSVEYSDATDLIGLLESLFYRILDENDVVQE